MITDNTIGAQGAADTAADITRRLKWDTAQAIELAVGRFPNDGPAAYRYVAEIVADLADR